MKKLRTAEEILKESIYAPMEILEFSVPGLKEQIINAIQIARKEALELAAEIARKNVADITRSELLDLIKELD